MNYLLLSGCLFTGIILVSLIATLGAIASNKYKFNYSYLSILSALIYIGLGYFVSTKFELKTAIMINGLTGLYDSTIGLWLSQKLNANISLSPEQVEVMQGPGIAITMVVIAGFFALLGFGISQL